MSDPPGGVSSSPGPLARPLLRGGSVRPHIRRQICAGTSNDRTGANPRTGRGSGAVCTISLPAPIVARTCSARPGHAAPGGLRINCRSGRTLPQDFIRQRIVLGGIGCVRCATAPGQSSANDGQRNQPAHAFTSRAHGKNSIRQKPDCVLSQPMLPLTLPFRRGESFRCVSAVRRAGRMGWLAETEGRTHAEAPGWQP